MTDPQGIAWEHFHTLADIPVFSEKAKSAGPASASASACCAGTAPHTPVELPVKQASCC